MLPGKTRVAASTTPQTVSREPQQTQKAPRWPKEGLQDGPRPPTEGSRTARDSPKTVQEGPTTMQDASREPRDGSTKLSEAAPPRLQSPKTTPQRGLQDGRRQPQDSPGGSHNNARRLTCATSWPNESLRGCPTAPLEPQDDPRRLQDSSRSSPEDPGEPQTAPEGP